MGKKSVELLRIVAVATSWQAWSNSFITWQTSDLMNCPHGFCLEQPCCWNIWVFWFVCFLLNFSFFSGVIDFWAELHASATGQLQNQSFSYCWGAGKNLSLTGSSYKADYEAVLCGGKMSVWCKECWKGQTQDKQISKLQPCQIQNPLCFLF